MGSTRGRANGSGQSGLTVLLLYPNVSRRRTTWKLRSPDSSSDIWEDDAPKGGSIQFQLTDSRINDLDRWVPLGRIDYLKDNLEELRDRFENADTGSDTDEFTENLVDSGETLNPFSSNARVTAGA